MKKSILLLSLFVLVATVATAQLEKPKKEFLISLSTNTLEVKPGETKEVTVNLIRSNAFSKSKAKLGLSSSLPTGISLVYEPGEGVIDSSVAKITVSADVKAGTYLVLPNAMINNKSKGTMLKVIVSGGSAGVASGR
jgi:hypothetical protein